MDKGNESHIRKVDVASAILLVAVLLAFGYVTIGASFRKMHRLKNEQTELSAQLDYLNELGETLGDSEGTLTELQRGMERLDQRLPAILDFESFYGFLSARALACNVEILEIQPLDIEAEENHVKLPVNIQAESSFNDIHAFLFQVMNSPRLTKLEQIRIRRDPNTDVCRIDMALAIYARNESATK